MFAKIVFRLPVALLILCNAPVSNMKAQTPAGEAERKPVIVELFTSEGFVLHADIVEIGRDGYLTVVGRKSDIIIRGGKNISAAVVEESAMSHPAISLAAAVPMPDRMFGERVSLYVELRPGASVTLAELQRFLADAGVSKEVFPEDLVVVEEIPRSSGAKVAKGDLRQDAARRSIEAESKGSTVR